jgi:hypothetical protein
VLTVVSTPVGRILVPGFWKKISVPDTSRGAFGTDIMLLLTDGSVLIHGAWEGGAFYPVNADLWFRLTPGDDGRYESGTWTSGGQMQYARQFFASGVMRDGRVFVIGGEYSDDPATPSFFPGSPYDDAWSGEIYDPQAPVDDPGLAWSPINKPGAFEFVRGDCNGSVLADGRVLLGGISPPVPPSGWSKLTAIWDPSVNKWVQAGLGFGTAGPSDKEDPFQNETFCLLPDGSVLAPAVRDTPGAQRYVPSLDQWVPCEDSPVPLAVTTVQGPQGPVAPYKTGPMILLPSGAAFAIGGTGLTALYTPPGNPAGKGSWTPGPTFPQITGGILPTLTALGAPACLLPSGKVVCMAGTMSQDGAGSVAPVLLEYDPASTATTLPLLDVQPDLPDLPDGNFTWQYFMLLLPTGQILLSTKTSTLLLYTPDPATSAPQDAWRPADISVPSEMYLGHSYPLSGTQLNGLSQAVCYGADGGMATNYPIVQLTSQAGRVAYARSHDFSTMGVATGATVQSCTIDIPSDLAPGEWDLVVIANGIPSEPPVRVNLTIWPCQGILDNPPNAGDYNTPAEYRTAVSDWLIELKACEREYGTAP